MAEPTRRPFAGLTVAIAFLTIVPVRSRGASPLGTAAPWFPLVGAAVGACAGGVAYLAAPGLGPAVAAALAVVVVVALTGALHLDGLADCADGLGARGGGAARRLEVMRDSANGTFGTLALGLWLVLAVTALAGRDRGGALDALIVAAAVGRWAALLHAAGTRPARRDGLGHGFEVSAGGLAIATAIALAIAVLVGGIGPGLASLAAAAIVAALVTAAARRGLGGRTGDTLGATIVLSEVVILVVTLGLA